MLDLILFLVKLPFILIRMVFWLVSHLVGLLLGIAGGLASGLWALFGSTLVVLFIGWLVVVLLRRRQVRAA
jgi:hypothetical protein